MKQVVIGIGGTGARCLESIIHIACAGLIRGIIDIGVVDQDTQNGNAKKSLGLASSRAAMADRLANATMPGGAMPCRFRVRDQTIVPLPQRPSLSELAQPGSMGGNPPGAWHLFHSLYTKEEQNTKAERGFYANPYVGHSSLGVAAHLDDENAEFWRKIDGLIGSRGGAEETRLLLVGSIFGGTGAAALPAIAEKAAEKGATGTKIAAILMLPYFHVDGDKDGTGPGPMSGERVALALQHYSKHLCSSERSVLSRIYLVGLSPTIAVRGKAVDGGSEQENEPMFPELLAGLAAADFFADEAANFKGPDTAVRIAARARSDAITWDDMPNPPLPAKRETPSAQPPTTKEALRWYMRFSLSYLAAVAPYYRDYEIFAEMAKRHEWFSNVSSSEDDFEEARKLCADFEEICRENLRWFESVTSAENLKMQIQPKQIDLKDLHKYPDPVAEVSLNVARRAYDRFANGGHLRNVVKTIVETSLGKRPPRGAPELIELLAHSVRREQ